MKYNLQLLIALISLLPLSLLAQNKKAPVWPEMKTFHSYMASTFHPAEEGNFAPLKAKADSMQAAAEKWSKSTVPSNFKEKETKEALSKLVAQCVVIKDAVAAGKTDDELKKLITDAHDIFHHIVGECRKADE